MKRKRKFEFSKGLLAYVAVIYTAIIVVALYVTIVNQHPMDALLGAVAGPMTTGIIVYGAKAALENISKGSLNEILKTLREKYTDNYDGLG